MIMGSSRAYLIRGCQTCIRVAKKAEAGLWRQKSGIKRTCRGYFTAQCTGVHVHVYIILLYCIHQNPHDVYMSFGPALASMSESQVASDDHTTVGSGVFCTCSNRVSSGLLSFPIYASPLPRCNGARAPAHSLVKDMASWSSLHTASVPLVPTSCNSVLGLSHFHGPQVISEV